MERFSEADFQFLLDAEATKDIADMAVLAHTHYEWLEKHGITILKQLQLSDEQRRVLAIKDKELHSAKRKVVADGGGDPDTVLPAWETVVRPYKPVVNRNRTDYTFDDPAKAIRVCIRRLLRYPTHPSSSFAKWGAGDGELRINHTFNVLNSRDSISLQELADATGLEIIIEVTSDSDISSYPVLLLTSSTLVYILRWLDCASYIYYGC